MPQLTLRVSFFVFSYLLSMLCNITIITRLSDQALCICSFLLNQKASLSFLRRCVVASLRHCVIASLRRCVGASVRRYGQHYECRPRTQVQVMVTTLKHKKHLIKTSWCCKSVVDGQCPMSIASWLLTKGLSVISFFFRTKSLH